MMIVNHDNHHFSGRKASVLGEEEGQSFLLEEDHGGARKQIE